VADDERGALAGRQTVDDRGHAALLELPQQEVALRIAERSDDVGAGGFAPQGLIEDVEVDLGLTRQAALEELVGDTEQPDLDRIGRDLIDLRAGCRKNIGQVALGALAIEREPEHEVVEAAPVRLDEPAQPFWIDLDAHPLGRCYTVP
jgi:hypothetical protein